MRYKFIKHHGKQNRTKRISCICLASLLLSAVWNDSSIVISEASDMNDTTAEEVQDSAESYSDSDDGIMLSEDISDENQAVLDDSYYVSNPGDELGEMISSDSYEVLDGAALISEDVDILDDESAISASQEDNADNNQQEAAEDAEDSSSNPEQIIDADGQNAEDTAQLADAAEQSAEDTAQLAEAAEQSAEKDPDNEEYGQSAEDSDQLAEAQSEEQSDNADTSSDAEMTADILSEDDAQQDDGETKQEAVISWQTAASAIELSDDWISNLKKTALVQVGYIGMAESEGSWSADFMIFCLNYAGIPSNYVPTDTDYSNWIQALQDKQLYRDAGWTPSDGDLVFLHEDTDDNNLPADHVAVIIKTGQIENEAVLRIIEGDHEGSVAKRIINCNDSSIAGYADIHQAADNFKKDNGLSETQEDTAADSPVVTDTTEAADISEVTDTTDTFETKETAETTDTFETIETIETVETESTTEITIEVETEAGTGAATEVQNEVATEAATEVITEVQTEATTEAATEIWTEAATEAATVVETEAETESITEIYIEAATETPTEVETEIQTETEALESVEEYETETEALESIGEYETETEALESVEEYETETESLESVEEYETETEALESVEEYETETEALESVDEYETETEALESVEEAETEDETENEELMITLRSAQTSGGYTIVVSGPVSSFPEEGDNLSVQVIEKTIDTDAEAYAAVEEEAQRKLEEQESTDPEAEQATGTKIYLFDITLLQNGEEIQPLGPVTITFEGIEKDETTVDAQVYHVDDEKNTEEMETQIGENGEISSETTHFSDYAVMLLTAEEESVSAVTTGDSNAAASSDAEPSRTFFNVTKDWTGYSVSDLNNNAIPSEVTFKLYRITEDKTTAEEVDTLTIYPKSGDSTRTDTWSGSFSSLGYPTCDENGNKYTYTIEEVKVGDKTLEESGWTSTLVSANELTNTVGSNVSMWVPVTTLEDGEDYLIGSGNSGNISLYRAEAYQTDGILTTDEGTVRVNTGAVKASDGNTYTSYILTEDGTPTPNEGSKYPAAADTNTAYMTWQALLRSDGGVVFRSNCYRYWGLEDSNNQDKWPGYLSTEKNKKDGMNIYKSLITDSNSAPAATVFVSDGNGGFTVAGSGVTVYLYKKVDYPAGTFDSLYVTDNFINTKTQKEPITSTEPEPQDYTDITVTKVWDDDGKTVDHSSDTVTMTLYANGVENQKITLTSADAEADDSSKWTTTIYGMPLKDEAENDITYTVSEDDMTDYTSSVTSETKDIETLWVHVERPAQRKEGTKYVVVCHPHDKENVSEPVYDDSKDGTKNSASRYVLASDDKGTKYSVGATTGGKNSELNTQITVYEGPVTINGVSYDSYLKGTDVGEEGSSLYNRIVWNVTYEGTATPQHLGDWTRDVFAYQSLISGLYVEAQGAQDLTGMCPQARFIFGLVVEQSLLDNTSGTDELKKYIQQLRNYGYDDYQITHMVANEKFYGLRSSQSPGGYNDNDRNFVAFYLYKEVKHKATTFTVTNTAEPKARVFLSKKTSNFTEVPASDPSEFEFTVYDSDMKELKKAEVITSENEAEILADGGITSSDRTKYSINYSVGDLSPGTYYIKETKAPSVYQTCSDYVRIDVAKDGKVSIYGSSSEWVQIQDISADSSAQCMLLTFNDPSTPITVPDTGGPGDRLIYTCGWLLLLLGAFMFMTLRAAFRRKGGAAGNGCRTQDYTVKIRNGDT